MVVSALWLSAVFAAVPSMAYMQDLSSDLGPEWIDPRQPLGHNLYGVGKPVPGAVNSSATAEAFASDFLDRHLRAIAPELLREDLHLSANRFDRGIRTVAYKQFHQGMEVLGGQISFRIKADQLSLIRRDLVEGIAVQKPLAPIGATRAEQAALELVRGDGYAPYHLSTSDLLVLRAGEDETADDHVVYRVGVHSDAPLGQWYLYIDATTGELIRQESTLHSSTATVLARVPVRHPGDEYMEVPLAYAGVDLFPAAEDTISRYLDSQGQVTWDTADNPIDLAIDFVGRYALISSQRSILESMSLTLADGESYLWQAVGDDAQEAALSAFVHTNIATEYALNITPNNEWLSQRLPVNVNLGDSCNAYFDGQRGSINFLSASGQCNNTAQLADVVYHEFGHGYHGFSIVPGAGAFDGALSEGVSDYFAATITDDSGMGRGFFRNDNALREINPPNSEARWPEDRNFDTHVTGLIIGGALWDLREAMIAEYGYDEGVGRADAIFAGIIQRAPDIPNTFLEALVEDDDDGDLSNGTPNECMIVEVFDDHGLVNDAGSLRGAVGVTQAPTADGFPIAAKGRCLAGSEPPVLHWRDRNDPDRGGEIVMTVEGRKANAFIPVQPEGTVIQYQVEMPARTLPSNPADPWYEMYVGGTTELYCTDFESRPRDDGWRSRLVAGVDEEGANDWQWGIPMGRSNDPQDAFSGSWVYGNDLGDGNYNGAYKPDRENATSSPEVEIPADATNVRLQYWRWLAVEDAQFDSATIHANDELVWSNLETEDGSTHHVDTEWRFHDVPLDGVVEPGGTVQITYGIRSDGGLEFGGWTLDDFCIVADAPVECGDGRVSWMEGETCDDGNLENGDGCDKQCQDETAEDYKAGCACDSSGHVGWSVVLLGLIGLRRRK